jgi:hypothetical protein
LHFDVPRVSFGRDGPHGQSPNPPPCTLSTRYFPLRHALPALPLPPDEATSRSSRFSGPRPPSDRSDPSPRAYYEQDAFSTEHGEALWGECKNTSPLCVAVGSPRCDAGPFLQVRRTGAGRCRSACMRWRARTAGNRPRRDEGSGRVMGGKRITATLCAIAAGHAAGCIANCVVQVSFAVGSLFGS